AGSRTVLPNDLHEQGQNGPTVAAVASVAGAQVAYQQMATAEHVQWEVTMVIVVGVKDLAGLVAMHRNIGAIKIQHNFLGWSLVLFNEVMPQQFVGLDHGLPVYALFRSAQC